MQNAPVVVVILKGGLGNHLFQYAAGLTAARRVGGTLVFRGLRGPTQLPDVLSSDVHPAPGDIAARVLRARDANRADEHDGVRWVGQGRGKAYAPMPTEPWESTADIFVLDGHFQHPSWFEESVGEVAEEVAGSFGDVMPAGVGRDVTVVSFRRGDYVQRGWELPIDYYERAVEMLLPTEKPTWVVGDDAMFVELAADWLRARGLAVEPSPDVAADPRRRDLLLTSVADTVVMSNSTYCWWGLMAGDPFGSRSGRVVLSPEHWLPIEGSDELLLPAWTTVSR